MKLLLITSFFCFGYASAQDVTADLKKMNLVYASAGSYQMDVTVESLAPGGNQVFSTQKAKVAVDGNRYYSSFNGITTIVNGEYAVHIDDNNKTVVIGSVNGKKKNLFKPEGDIESLIDSLVNLSSKEVKTLQRTESQLRLMVKMDDPHYSKMTYNIDLKTHYLTQVVYYLRSGSDYPFDRLRINYSNIQVGKNIPKSQFSLDKYMRVRGKNVQLTAAYSNYELINNIGYNPNQP